MWGVDVGGFGWCVCVCVCVWGVVRECTNSNNFSQAQKSLCKVKFPFGKICVKNCVASSYSYTKRNSRNKITFSLIKDRMPIKLQLHRFPISPTIAKFLQHSTVAVPHEDVSPHTVNEENSQKVHVRNFNGVSIIQRVGHHMWKNVSSTPKQPV
jgi:hypothetical protein